MTTIVTAYFKLEKSKSNHETYDKWMNNMLIIQSPMVIFCDENSVEMIQSKRNPNLQTKIIPITFTEFFCYKYFQQFEIDYETKDHEKYHNPHLYLIWNEKSHFLKLAAEMNVFSTQFFLWVDIGCFREKNTTMIHWPNTAKMPIDKLLLLSVYPFTDEEYQCNIIEDLPDFKYVEGRIGGTIFGGTLQSILTWHQNYYHILEFFIKMDRFIGKDQNIMSSVAIIYKDTVEFISSREDVYNKWFYLQLYLSYPQIQNPFKKMIFT